MLARPQTISGPVEAFEPNAHPSEFGVRNRVSQGSPESNRCRVRQVRRVDHGLCNVPLKGQRMTAEPTEASLRPQ
jgi:hypothetical protein